MKILVLLFTAAAASVSVRSSAAPAPVFAETLSQAEILARGHSGTLKASLANSEAAGDQADAVEAQLFPRLTLDGTYSYQTHVPQVNFGASPFGNLSFGTYDNYNVGPTLSYTLFDGGQSRNLWKSGKILAHAREEDFKNAEKQTVLNLRLVYFKLQLSLKNLELTSDSLKLAQAQDHDIRNRLRAGAASRLDAINSNRNVLSYRLAFQSAQNELGAALRDLFDLTGDARNLDTARPVPLVMKEALPEGVGAPTLLIDVDAISKTAEALTGKHFEEPGPAHPQIKSLEFASEASNLAARAQKSALWPRIQFSARSELMYPDLILPEAVGQNIFSVNLSMPLFEGGLNRHLASQHAREAMVAEYQSEQKLTDLERDWHKASDLLANLRSDRIISQENSKQAAVAAKLTYQSYRLGKKEYLDVESADLQLLQAKVGEAQIESNILVTLAQLDYLSPE